MLNESNYHNEAKQMNVLAATTDPIDEQSNTKLADQKRNNKQISHKILENMLFYLGRDFFVR